MSERKMTYTYSEQDRFVLIQGLPALNLVINRAREALVADLVQSYSTGSLNENSIWGKVGALAELEQIRTRAQNEANRIDNEITKGMK